MLDRRAIFLSRSFEGGQHILGLVQDHIGFGSGRLEVSAVHLDMVLGGVHLEPHLGRDAAIHSHAALANQLLRLAARGEAGIRDHLLQADGVHSHSMVLGGFELMSKTTRFTPFTSLMILVDTAASTSGGNLAQSAVMPSTLVTARTATTFS